MVMVSLGATLSSVAAIWWMFCGQLPHYGGIGDELHMKEFNKAKLTKLRVPHERNSCLPFTGVAKYTNCGVEPVFATLCRRNSCSATESYVIDAEKLRAGIVCCLAYVDAPTTNTLSTSHDMHFRVDGGAMLYRDVAIALWDRMIALPHGEQMRCHTPRYAIHLDFSDGQFYTAAICWECNNISISSSGDYSWQTFNGQSDEAQSLLADIRDYVSDVDTKT